MDTNPAAAATLTIELDGDVLDALQIRAKAEGRSVNAVVQALLAEAVAGRYGPGVDPTVMAHYERSLERFGPLYERLAR